ncbi:MAG TPA: hypothetical protein VFU34_01575 [Gaiellaceae bacterium]|nr:hypothetical protein [Gaiellaceae bacterium]
MASERRSEEEIRREIASEREELVRAFADLRKSVESKRRAAAVAAGTIAAGLAASAAIKAMRRVKGARGRAR